MAVPDGRPVGVILAGGLARRMGGREKALLPLAGRDTALTLLLSRLEPQCSRLAISANRQPERFAITGLPVLPDGAASGAGPLAGVLAGLGHLATAMPDGWLLSVPGDTPFVPDDLVGRLAAAARDAALPCARAASGGRPHPAVALWSARLYEPLHAALMQRDLRRVSTFQDEVGCATADWPDTPRDPFFNINTPEDLAAARLMATCP